MPDDEPQRVQERRAERARSTAEHCARQAIAAELDAASRPAPADDLIGNTTPFAKSIVIVAMTAALTLECTWLRLRLALRRLTRGND